MITQRNKFYIHTSETPILSKLCIPYLVVEDDKDLIYTQYATLLNAYCLITSQNKLDPAYTIGFRKSGLHCFCTYGCCGTYVDINTFVNMFYVSNLALTSSGLSEGFYSSGFGVYLRELFAKWIWMTNFDRYILHGCEAESLREFSYLHTAKNLLFYGMPEYKDETFLIRSTADVNVIRNFNDEILKMYGGMISVEKFLYSEYVLDFVPDGYASFCDYILFEGYTVKDCINKKILRSASLCNYRIYYIVNDFDIDYVEKGYINDIFISRVPLGNMMLREVYARDGLYLYELYKIVVDNYIAISTRNVVQRCLIRYGNMYDIVPTYQNSNEINIAIFVMDRRNAYRWAGSEKPLSNIIGTIANPDSAQMYGIEVNFDHKVPTYIDGRYNDIMADSVTLFNFGYNAITVAAFETLICPLEYKPIRAKYHPCDYRRIMIQVFTDRNSSCNVQNILTSATYDLKSVSLLYKMTKGCQDDAIYRDRFNYAKSKLGNSIKFKTKFTMWSLGYAKMNESLPLSSQNIWFFDMSGHFVNFIAKSMLICTDIKGHLNMVKNNLELVGDTYDYFSINVDYIYKLSKFVNAESRDPYTKDNILWHTKQEYLLACEYALIFCKIFKSINRVSINYKHVFDFIRNLSISEKYADVNYTSMTVRHDQQHATEILREISDENL